MSAAVAAVPTTGTAKSTVFRIDVTGAPANTTTGYTTTIYPTEPEVVYYLAFTATGADTKYSYRFSTNPYDGTHSFNNFMFDKAATWTVTLTDAADDSSVATTTVVVS